MLRGLNVDMGWGVGTVMRVKRIVGIMFGMTAERETHYFEGFKLGTPLFVYVLQLNWWDWYFWYAYVGSYQSCHLVVDFNNNFYSRSFHRGNCLVVTYHSVNFANRHFF